MPLCVAVPIYPQTKDFAHLFLILEEHDDDHLTAYGVTLSAHNPPDREIPGDCCNRGGCDAMVEHGATFSPKEGVPFHLACLLERGGMLVARSQVMLL